MSELQRIVTRIQKSLRVVKLCLIQQRLIALKEVIIDEDERRNLFTLDNVKHEKVKLHTFSGDRKEDVLKFKIKLTEAFNKNSCTFLPV